MKFIFLLPAIFSVACATAQKNRFTIQAGTGNIITVAAGFNLVNDTIFMFTRGATPQLPEGEAGFVRNLVVKDEKGATIPSRYAGEGNWILQNTQPGQLVQIRYELLADHKAYNWDHVGGIDEAAFTNNDGFFFTGYTLFIVPGMSMENILVNFNLPTGWQASTPWLQQQSNNFTVENARYLINNCLVIGKHTTAILRVGGMEMRLALANKISYAKPLIIKTMEKLLPAYQEMFGASPAPVYLVALSDERMTDGSAFRRSFSQIFKDTIDEKGMKTWGYIMAHEILHLWNGHSLVARAQEEWFKEGFTDYMTNVMLRRTGLIDDESVYRKLEHIARRYWLDRFWQRDTLSIRATGDHKEQLRFGVYGGGALVAIALEVEMRKASGNKNGIYELMKSVFAEFGLNKKTYALEDIVHHVNQLAGKNLQGFFDQYVTGHGFLDIGPYLREMGLDYHTVIDEVYVSPYQQATSLQQERYRRIFIQ